MITIEQSKCEEHGVITGSFTLGKEMMPQTVKVSGRTERFYQDLRGPLGQMAALVYPTPLETYPTTPLVEEGAHNA